jgi:PAS domain S-box-containing protein
MHQDAVDPCLNGKINFFLQVAENIDALLWMADRNNQRLICVNEKYEALWGRTCESLYEDMHSYVELICGEDQERVLSAVATLVTHHQKYDIEYRVIRADGSLIWVRDRGFPIQDGVGQVTYLVGLVEDITLQKQAELRIQTQLEEIIQWRYLYESTLRSKEEYLQTINQSIPSVIFQFTANQWTGQGKFTYMSSKATELFEFDPAGEDDIEARMWSLVHPDDLPRMRESVANAVQHRRPWQAEYRVITPSGQEKWIRVQSEPADTPEGVSIQNGVLIDISDRKQVEAVLTQKNAELQAIYEAFPDLFFRMEGDGTILEYKAGHTSDLYVPPENFLGRRMQDVLPEPVAQLLDNSFTRAQETHSLICIEYTLPVASGEEYFEGRIVPLQGNQLMAIMRNISHRKRAERSLKTLANQQAKIAQFGQKALANTELSYLMENVARVIAEGLEVEYSKVLELLPNRKKFLLRAGLGWESGLVGQATIDAGAESQAGYAIQLEEPVLVENIVLETRFSASPLLEKHQIVSGISVVVQGQQRVYGVISGHSKGHRIFTQDDVYFLQSLANILATAIDRKESELAIQMLNAMLEEHNQNLEALVEQRTSELTTFINSLPDYIYVIQRFNRRIQFCNDQFASITRFKDSHETLGKTLQDCFLRRYANVCDKQNLQVFESGESAHLQESFQLRDGLRPTGGHRTVHLDTYKIPLKQPNGEVYALITSSRDITELIEARQAILERTIQLEATNQELDAFAYSVSHDLRAPLRHIHGFVNALRQEFGQSKIPLNAKMNRYLEVIENSSSKMGQLIDGLLTLSRVGRRDLNIRPIPLRSLVESAIEIVSPHPQSHRLPTLEWRIGTLPTLKGDPSLLQQVFTNLLENAIKFSRDRDPAIIEIDCLEHQTIVVKDNGVGFSMKYADQLFGAFQRLHTQQEFEGTGIGLAIVQRIIHRHGGKIWAESEPDQGATFYFQLGSIILEEKNIY